MWTIGQLKENGKRNFMKNYWYCVVVSIVLALCVGGSSGYAGRNVSSETTESENALESIFNSLSPEALFAIFGLVGFSFVIVIAIKILLLGPLGVGCQKFFLANRVEDKASLNEMTYAFKTNWLNIVLGVFLKDLFLVLWFLLLIVPGIIKTYSYRLVPYLLADNPDMQPMEAITLSRQMMNGQKFNAFVYDLSFIGWYLLTAITCGIVGVFYTLPYKNASDAELYTAIKENYRPQ